jgi:hypothetical protein
MKLLLVASFKFKGNFNLYFGSDHGNINVLGKATTLAPHKASKLWRESL